MSGWSVRVVARYQGVDVVIFYTSLDVGAIARGNQEA